MVMVAHITNWRSHHILLKIISMQFDGKSIFNFIFVVDAEGSRIIAFIVHGGNLNAESLALWYQNKLYVYYGNYFN
jgi:hypothetical protein